LNYPCTICLLYIQYQNIHPLKHRLPTNTPTEVIEVKEMKTVSYVDLTLLKDLFAGRVTSIDNSLSLKV